MTTSVATATRSHSRLGGGDSPSHDRCPFDASRGRTLTLPLSHQHAEPWTTELLLHRPVRVQVRWDKSAESEGEAAREKILCAAFNLVVFTHFFSSHRSRLVRVRHVNRHMKITPRGAIVNVEHIAHGSVVVPPYTLLVDGLSILNARADPERLQSSIGPSASRDVVRGLVNLASIDRRPSRCSTVCAIAPRCNVILRRRGD
ncbi:hypothetical protein C8R47DRAFT_1081710 [Mycena vitilis]|nr:hypothetical protein C8R47DRAFT_1081710 [Mycena vitilis]